MIENKQMRLPAIPKKETDIHPTLHVFLYELLIQYGIQVVRESDEGIGSLDLCCLYTTQHEKAVSISIEIKLAHHKRLRHGIEKQLPAYMQARKCKHGLYVILWFKDPAGKFFDQPYGSNLESTKTWVENTAGRISSALSIRLQPIVIDASIKPSASVH